MKTKKTPIPIDHREGSGGPKEVRSIDPSSDEGKRILQEMEQELPENFGNPKKKYRKGLYYHDPERNKKKIVEGWGEKKTLQEWVEDPRAICKIPRILRSRLKGGWTLERALTTPYEGLYP